MPASEVDMVTHDPVPILHCRGARTGGAICILHQGFEVQRLARDGDQMSERVIEH